LFDWAAITVVGAAHAAFNDVLQTHVDHVTADAKAGHQRSGRPTQVMGGSFPFRQFKGLAFSAAALHAPVYIVLTIDLPPHRPDQKCHEGQQIKAC
jgi:hypothetical protein